VIEIELPITVTIVLFVAIVVGIVMIQFSKETINDAKDRLLNYGKSDVPKEQVIEINNATGRGIVNLAAEWANAGNNPSKINVSNVDSSNSLFIYYNPLGDKVEISK